MAAGGSVILGLAAVLSSEPGPWIADDSSPTRSATLLLHDADGRGRITAGSDTDPSRAPSERTRATRPRGPGPDRLARQTPRLGEAVARPERTPEALARGGPDRAAARERTDACEVERCDGRDTDCDGEIDEPGAIGCTDLHFDDDGDGFGASFAGCWCQPPRFLVVNDLDCDDRRSDVHPGAAEICDGEVDNDCDGFRDLCGASPRTRLAPGDVTIRSAQDRPGDVPDRLGEWFEIENRTDRTLELMGLEVRDDGFDGFRVRRSLVLPPGGTAILGRNGDPATNGQIPVDYVYSDFVLSNFGDAIELRSDGAVIDRVVYADTGELFPDAP